MERRVQVRLPGGLWSRGVRHADAWLRPLSGGDEAFLDEAGAGMPAAQCTTALLARCVERLGPLEDPGPATLRSLTVGDRESLVLHLRRITFGDSIQCVLTCPAERCGETMDLDLSVSDLLCPPYPGASEHHEIEAETDGVRQRVRFRLPSGADQEAAAETADLAAGAAVMMARCVEASLPPDVAAVVEAAMERLDPQAETRLAASCPACGASFETLLDAAELLVRECAGRRDHLYREVHALALTYHWGEAEIMAMTPRRRRRYLEMVAESAGSAW